jgi:amino acid permease
MQHWFYRRWRYLRVLCATMLLLCLSFAGYLVFGDIETSNRQITLLFALFITIMSTVIAWMWWSTEQKMHAIVKAVRDEMRRKRTSNYHTEE